MVGWSDIVLAADAVDAGLLVLFAVAGGALLALRPQTPSSVALGLFLVGYGIGLACYAVQPFAPLDLGVALAYVAVLFLMLATFGLLQLTRHFPRPLPPGGWRTLPIAMVAGALYAARSILDIDYVLRHDVHYATWDTAWTNALAQGIGYTWSFAAFCFFLTALGLRSRALARSGDGDAARAAALVALTSVPVGVLVLTVDFLYDPGLTGLLPTLYVLLAVPPVLAWLYVWLRATHGVPPAASRHARNVVLAIVTFGLLGLGLHLLGGAGRIPFVAARALGLGVLVYAILKQQLFDADIRLKLTLKRSTVAAIFLGAFFVAAQLAQNFLSDSLGWGVGGVAAGLLLFTLNPIQRAAERLSDKAMPGVRPQDPKYILQRKRETYRNAYATAWGDGNLTAKDMRMLQQVREALGLPDKDIVAIEREWTAKSA